jgi:hypothetical protein
MAVLRYEMTFQLLLKKPYGCQGNFFSSVIRQRIGLREAGHDLGHREELDN